MKLCDTCIYGDKYELEKPCIIYRDDCKLYEEKKMDDMTRAEAIEVLQKLASYESGLLEYMEEHSVSVQDALLMAINSLQIDEQYDLMYEQAKPTRR